MVGKVTTREPIRGAMAREIQEYLTHVATARKQGTLQRAQSQHKTNIRLTEVSYE